MVLDLCLHILQRPQKPIVELLLLHQSLRHINLWSDVARALLRYRRGEIVSDGTERGFYTEDFISHYFLLMHDFAQLSIGSCSIAYK